MSVAGSIAYDNIGFKYSTLVEALLMGLTVLVVGFVSTSKYYSCPRCRPIRDLEAIFTVRLRSFIKSINKVPVTDMVL